MNIQTTDRFVVFEEVLSQEVNGETVLLDLEGESYFGLDEVGTRVWQLLQAKSTVADTLDTLFKEYDVSREQLESDVGELWEKLVDAGLISLLNDQSQEIP